MFHISHEFIKEDFWKPRFCRSDNNGPRWGSENSLFWEPPIPRICFAPTISQCLLAMGCYLEEIDKWTNLYLYHPNLKYCKKLYPAFQVHDAHITDEHWILKPINMIFFGEIQVRAKETIEFGWFDRNLRLRRLGFEVRGYPRSRDL